MKTPCATAYYDLYGLGLGVYANAEISAAIHARLKQFQVNPTGLPDFRFEFCFVSDSGGHIVSKPTGRARPFYDPPLGEFLYFDDEDQIYIYYNDPIRVFCDPARGQVRTSILKWKVDWLWLVSHPMFTIPLIELLKRRGRYNLHAAALVVNGTSFLFPGNSGAGKSTLTIALLRAGFQFMGDDMVFLSAAEDDLQVLAFPEDIDVTDQTVCLFPELDYLSRMPKAAGYSKHQICAQSVYGADIIPACRPAIMVFPEIGSTHKSQLKRISSHEALLKLAPNVLLTQRRATQDHLDVLSRLVQATDCYHLTTGRDFHELPRVLKNLVS